LTGFVARVSRGPEMKNATIGALGISLFGAALAAAGCNAIEPIDQGENVGSYEQGAKIDCSFVKCAMPLCAEGQHLKYQGGCCPVCVGPEKNSKCAAVLCAAVECGEDEILVTSPGQCCGQCKPAPQVKECSSDADCPVYYCIQCPCPYSECQGGQCVTQTPDESTCGGGA